MMNNKLVLISLLISFSVQIFGQDVVPRQTPIDNKPSIEDSIKNYKDDNPETTKIPIIIDSTEGCPFKGFFLLQGMPFHRTVLSFHQQ